MDLIVLITMHLVDNLPERAKGLQLDYCSDGEFVKVMYRGVCIAHVIFHHEESKRTLLVTQTFEEALQTGEGLDDAQCEQVKLMLAASVLYHSQEIIYTGATRIDNMLGGLYKKGNEITMRNTKLSTDELIDLCKLTSTDLLYEIGRALGVPQIISVLTLFKVYKKLFIDPEAANADLYKTRPDEILHPEHIEYIENFQTPKEKINDKVR